MYIILGTFGVCNFVDVMCNFGEVLCNLGKFCVILGKFCVILGTFGVYNFEGRLVYVILEMFGVAYLTMAVKHIWCAFGLVALFVTWGSFGALASKLPVT